MNKAKLNLIKSRLKDIQAEIDGCLFRIKQHRKEISERNERIRSYENRMLDLKEEQRDLSQPE